MREKNLSRNPRPAVGMTAGQCGGRFFQLPAGVGSANNGSNDGGSVLNSNNDVSNTNTNYGGALTPNRLQQGERKRRVTARRTKQDWGETALLIAGIVTRPRPRGDMLAGVAQHGCTIRNGGENNNAVTSE